MSLVGSFLIARPVLQDPNFAQTVVLILAHSEDGAFGLVVNRPAEESNLPFPVFAGGPCESPGLILLHGHEDWHEAGDDAPESKSQQEVAPGIFLGDATCLSRATELSDDEPPRFRVFRGYSGWGKAQLEGELAAGAWAITPASGEVLFDTAVEDLWEQLVPPRIPQPSLN